MSDQPIHLPTPPNPAVAGATTEIYRTTPEAVLEIQMLLPAKSALPGPGIVFFFGGGWQNGNVSHFLLQATHCHSRGIAAFLVNYRVSSRHGTTPVAAIEDARSAMRYLKKNAARLGIDPARLVGSGGSAGGHLAFCTALATTLNAAEDDLSVDPAPSLIVGFNPVCDTSEAGFGFERFPSGTALRGSPVHLVTSAMPPALIMHGTDDCIVPVRHARAMKAAMLAHGVPCELVEYEGRGHGFFNEGPDFGTTLAHLDRFLVEAGILPR
jgi:acetyl esterase